MFGPDTNQTHEQEQFSAELYDLTPPNEDQGENKQDTYEDRVDDAITGVMEEDEGDSG